MEWYERTVYPWRTVGSTVWLIIIITPFLLLYHILTMSSVWALIGMESFLYISVYYTSVILLHVTQSWLTTVQSCICKFRYQKILKMFKISHVLFVLLCVAMATIQSNCLVHNGWSNQGMIIGLLYGVRFIKEEQFVLRFPLIQQGKFFEIRSRFIKVVKFSLLQAIKDLVICVIVLFVINLWSTSISIFNIRLLWLLFVNGFYMELIWKLSVLIHTIFQSQSIQFPVIATFNEDTNQTLLLALQSNNIIVNYLGFMDLAKLSVQSQSRRAQIYSVSSNGPVVWDNIYQQCISKLNTLCSCFDEEYSVQMLSFTEPIETVNKSRVIKRGWSDATPTLTRRHINIERAALSVQDVPYYEVTPTECTKKKKETVSLSKCVTNYLKSIPIIGHLIAELPDSKVNEAYGHTVLYIWVITAVSHLCVYSYTEDQYGVVQKSLANVLRILLKLSSLLQKPSNNTLEQIALKNVVEQSLQLLACTFHHETKVLELSSDNKWTQLINSV